MALASINTGEVISIITLIVFGLVFHIVFATIPANIAKNKGYGFAGFFILGLFGFFLIALIIALCLSDKNQQMNEFKTTLYSANNAPNQKEPPMQSEQIGAYYSLLQQGAISQEEFDAMKKKILCSSSNIE